ncbi:response regulator [Trichlorobacter ammonificans]|uniref:Response regulator receiver protein n=1 Tax=Trichlorobacter ammonificans TaxID=2916410 RepID=A0ABN8HJJ2_9BACT|nr:response regulator [Trichlorobacter ammonificans]CAH2030192.1 Response regulator receiver protein [Trichlorobacter ammonificans]
MPDCIRVLCLDDEKNILNTVRRQLEDDSFQVFQAQTVEEALRILESEQPLHVVLSDYRMPGTTGVDFLRTVAGRWPWISGIIISGFADTQAVQRALADNPAMHFIAKPWTMEELLRIVRQAASQAREVLTGG